MTDHPLALHRTWAQLPICSFRTDERIYVFDGSSGHIVLATPAAGELLQWFGRESTGVVWQRLVHRYGKTEAEAAVAWMGAAYEAHGLFQPRGAVAIAPAVDRTTMQRKLDTEVRFVTLELTQDCNLRCRYCVHGSLYPTMRPHRPRAMSFDTAASGIDLLRRCSSSHDRVVIGFHGGEPLLEFDLLKQCVSYARSSLAGKPVQFHMTTNCTRMNRDIARYLSTEGFHLLVSLDGPADIHNRHRVNGAGKGSYQSVERGLRLLRAADPEWYGTNVMFCCTLAPPRRAWDVFEFFSNGEMTRGHSLTVNGLRPGHGDVLSTPATAQQNAADDAVRLEQLLLEFARSVCLTRDRNDRLSALLAFYPLGTMKMIHERSVGAGLWGDGPRTPPGCCLPSTQRLYVTAEGRLFPCERTNHECEALCLGDVRQGVVADRVAQMLDAFYLASADLCQQCWALPICGMCLACYDDPGGLRADDKRSACEWNRGILKHALELYCRLSETDPRFLEPYMVSGELATVAPDRAQAGEGRRS